MEKYSRNRDQFIIIFFFCKWNVRNKLECKNIMYHLKKYRSVLEGKHNALNPHKKKKIQFASYNTRGQRSSIYI